MHYSLEPIITCVHAPYWNSHVYILLFSSKIKQYTYKSHCFRINPYVHKGPISRWSSPKIPPFILLFLAKSLKMLHCELSKTQVVKFDTPKLGLGLFKKHCLERCLELKERVNPAEQRVRRTVGKTWRLWRNHVDLMTHTSSGQKGSSSPSIQILVQIIAREEQIQLQCDWHPMDWHWKRDLHYCIVIQI